MSFARFFLATTAIGLSLCATTASADLTAQDVWGDWRTYLQSMGFEVTATATETGDTLAVTDIAAVTNILSAGAVTIRAGRVEFIENSDGSVEIMMPDTMPITVELPADGINPAVQVTAAYTQNGQRMTVSGDPAAMVYDYRADTVGLALTSLTVGGIPLGDDAARFSLIGGAFVSRTNMVADRPQTFARQVQLGSASLNGFFNAPNDVSALSITSELTDLSFTGSNTLPAHDLPAPEGLSSLLAAGFLFDGLLRSKTTETKIEITSEEGTTRLKTGSADTTLALEADTDGVRYAGEAEKVQIGAQLAGLPFPLFIEMEKYGFEAITPVVKSDTPQNFKVGFDVSALTMSDVFWALLDPQANLPRDPFNIGIDVTGTANIQNSPLNTQTLLNMANTRSIPPQINSLKVNRFTVDAVGATLNATSDLTFDHANPIRFPALPRIPDLPSPTGNIQLDLTGATALLARLAEAGRLRPDQSLMAQLALRFITVPGAGPDTLKSRIEFTQAGQIFANGQQLK